MEWLLQALNPTDQARVYGMPFQNSTPLSFYNVPRAAAARAQSGPRPCFARIWSKPHSSCPPDRSLFSAKGPSLRKCGLMLACGEFKVQKVRNMNQSQYRPDDSRDGEQLLVMLDM